MLQMKNLFQNYLGKTKSSLIDLFSHKITYFYIAMFVALLGCVFSEIAVYFVFALVAVVSVMFSFDKSLTFTLCLFPFAGVISLGGVIYIIIPLATVLLIHSVKYFIEVLKKKKTINWWFAGIILAFSVYLLLPIRDPLASDKGEFFSLYDFANIFMFLDMIYLIWAYKDEIKIDKAVIIFSISLIASCLYFLLKPVSARLTGLLPAIYQSEVCKFNALVGFNPNSLALTAGLTLTILLYMIVTSKIKYESLFLLVPIFIFGYLTISRQFLFSIFIALCLMFVVSLIKKNYTALKILLIFAGIGALVALIFSNVTNIFLGRLSIKDAVSGYNDAATLPKEELVQIVNPGRGGLIKIYLWDWVSSAMIFLFGRGVQTGYINNFNAHNTFIHLFWESGLIGGLCFIAILFLTVKNISNANFVGTIKNIFGKWENYVLYVPVCALLFVENIFLKPMFIVMSAIFIFALLAQSNKNMVSNNESTNENEKDVSE